MLIYIVQLLSDTSIFFTCLNDTAHLKIALTWSIGCDWIYNAAQWKGEWYPWDGTLLLFMLYQMVPANLHVASNLVHPCSKNGKDLDSPAKPGFWLASLQSSAEALYESSIITCIERLTSYTFVADTYNAFDSDIQPNGSSSFLPHWRKCET